MQNLMKRAVHKELQLKNKCLPFFLHLKLKAQMISTQEEAEEMQLLNQRIYQSRIHNQVH